MAIPRVLKRIKILEEAALNEPNVAQYLICETPGATRAKTASYDGASLISGQLVWIKFRYANTVANPTMNINDTGALPITKDGAAIPLDALEAGKFYEFYYTGSAYEYTREVGFDSSLTKEGGTMTGDLNFSNTADGIIADTSDNHTFVVQSNTNDGDMTFGFDSSTGSNINVKSKADGGTVTVEANDATDSSSLILNPDGTATWHGYNIITAEGGADHGVITGDLTANASLYANENIPDIENSNKVATTKWANKQFVNVTGDTMSDKLTISSGGLELTKGNATLGNGNLTLTKGSATLTEGSLTLANGDATLKNGDLTLTKGDALLSSGSLTLTKGDTTLTNGSLTLKKGNATLTEGSLTLTKGNAILTEGNLTLTKGSTTLTEGDLTLASGDALLSNGDLTLTNGDALLNYGNLTLTKGNTTLTEGDLTLTKGNTLLNEGNFTLTKGDTTLTEGNLTITKGNATLTEGDLTLDNGDALLSDGNLTLTNGDALLSDGNLTLTKGNATLTEGSLTLTKGNTTLSNGSLTLSNGSLTLSNGNATISNGSLTTHGNVNVYGSPGSSEGGQIELKNGTDAGNGIILDTTGNQLRIFGTPNVGTVFSINPQNGSTSFVKKSGDTMTGTLYYDKSVAGNPSISCTDDGACVYLYDKGNATYDGGFICRAKKSDGTNVDLIGKGNGDLTWNGQSLGGAVPVGTIILCTHASISGYLHCNGGAVSRTTYSNLFNAIGGTFGTGDGWSTFNLPNLSDGRFIECSSPGTYKNAGLPNITGSVNDTGPTNVVSNIYRDASGAFYTTIRGGEGVNGPWTDDAFILKFDASRSNSVYGSSTTVQPKSLTLYAFIKY